MTHYLQIDEARLRDDPLILFVPGSEKSDLQVELLRETAPYDWHCVDLGMWDNPHRNTWVNKLNLAIHQAERPVILVAQGFGCLVAAWWAEFEQPRFGNPVIGALLLAPPDVERPGTDDRLAKFGACPKSPLPCPSFLVAHHRDANGYLRSARTLARRWDCRFILADDPGGAGRSGAEFARRLLDQLVREHRIGIRAERPVVVYPPRPSLPEASYAQALLTARFGQQA